ncbi:MAG: hybrid sensor histidine kinase/response regulator, partial [Proteobacteria bacterium]|nr:hybrid sensor histidine kinase/response regulator [Pseudomonadota bacterium]
MVEAIKKFLKKSFDETQFPRSSIKALGFIGLTCHPLYWFFWTYVFPQGQDLWTIRFSSAAFCGLFTLENYWPRFLKKYFHILWFFCVVYALPFLFTLHLILNQFSDIWLMCETGVLFMVGILLPNLILMTLNLIFGIGLAIFYFLITNPSLLNLSHFDLKYLPIFSFAYLAGFIFIYCKILDTKSEEKIKSEERSKVLKSLAGSIVHEIRNPLNTINLIGIQIGRLLSKSSAEFDLSTQSETKEQLIDLTSDISETVTDANNIIKIILSDLSEKQVLQEDFSHLSAKKVLPNIISKYGYKNDDERKKVKLDFRDSIDSNNKDFIFKAVQERLSFIIYNLIKNALYYARQYPDLIIKIGTDPQPRKYKGKLYNVIYVKDINGPGIKPDLISKLFDDFYTVGKKEGTGLGLSFCKRNMNLFGGDIICESEIGKWTKFSLLFPEVDLNVESSSDSESYFSASDSSKENKSSLNLVDKVILIADDDQTTLKNLKEYLISLNAEVITANNGKELLDRFVEITQSDKNTDCKTPDLIITDINMPIMNGDEAAKLIREYEKQQNLKPIPIIAATG